MSPFSHPVTVCLLFSILLLSLLTNSTIQAKQYQGVPSFSAKNTNTYSPTRSSYISSIMRLNMTYTHRFNDFEVTISPDLDIDYTDQTHVIFSPTEYYLDLYLQKTDLRLGRQSFSWGSSPIQSLNNFLTPVTLTEFVLPDPEDLPDARLALSVIQYFGANYLHAVYAPATRATELPDVESIWFPAQSAPSFVDLAFEPAQESSLFDGHQFAFRAALRSLPQLEIDLMGYYWTQPLPSLGIYFTPGAPGENPLITLQQELRRSWMAGAALSWSSGRWIVRQEWLIIPDRQVHRFNIPVSRLRAFSLDPQSDLGVLSDFELREDGYLISKPSLSNTTGFEVSLWGGTLGGEVQTRILYGVTDNILAEPITFSLTGFFERSFANDRLQILSLGTYQPTGRDFWGRLEISYQATDTFSIGTGGNVFSGPEPEPLYSEVTFHSFRKNSSFYLKFTLDL